VVTTDCSTALTVPALMPPLVDDLQPAPASSATARITIVAQRRIFMVFLLGTWLDGCATVSIAAFPLRR